MPCDIDDLDFLHSIYTDSEMMKFLNGPLPKDVIKQRLEKWRGEWEKNQLGPFVIFDRNSRGRVGLVAIFEANIKGEPILELGWMVPSDQAGNGIATEAARGSIRYGRKLFPAKAIAAFPGVENIASNRICEKLGMRRVGPYQYHFVNGNLNSVEWRLETNEAPKTFSGRNHKTKVR
jgi:RimJ/RimL family protein N-acetyltransferase